MSHRMFVYATLSVKDAIIYCRNNGLLASNVTATVKGLSKSIKTNIKFMVNIGMAITSKRTSGLRKSFIRRSNLSITRILPLIYFWVCKYALFQF